MPGSRFDLELRPATLEDAALIADLETLRDPEEPRDPVAQRFWWAFHDKQEVNVRRIAINGDAALAFVAAWHQPWDATVQRFGNLRAILRPDVFTRDRFDSLVRTAEEWLHVEGVRTAIARAREDFHAELSVLQELGFREVRRQRNSELDLAAQRDQILHMLELCRNDMRDRGVRLMTLSEDQDPDKLHKLYAMMTEAEQDIPTTAPWRVLPFDKWLHFWFDHPGIRTDHFWIARKGDDIVGLSTLDFPVTRGIPYTALTATARSARGQGIARALKYESMNQAMALGFKRVRTSNDADNAPILRINNEMGYRLVIPVIELHKGL